jgi:hypothetical protein
MAKSTRKRHETAATQKKDHSSRFAVDKKALDPSLASLFASSVRIHFARIYFLGV